MSKINENDIVQRLARHFYKSYHNFHLALEEVMSMNLEEQQRFLDATVNSEHLRKYPVNNVFSRLFFKKLIAILEKKQDIHDNFYTYLCSVMKSSNASDSFYYRHFLIGNGLSNIVTIKETKNMVINGTTGLRTWDAALMLADYALCNKSMFANKIVLELGSGVGFTGITIAKQCEAKSIILTDCHDDVLRTISENIQINFPCLMKEEISTGTAFRDQKKYLGVMNLDWNNIHNVDEQIIPDIIVGADIVYDPSIITPLCQVINTLGKRNKDLQVFIANIIRNEDTWKLFLETIDSMNLVCKEIVQTQSVFIEWDNSIRRCLLQINKNLM